MTVREKVLSTDWDDWNHPRRAIVCLVFVAGFSGGAASFLLDSLPGPWIVRPVAAAFLVGTTMLLAGAIFAAFD